MAPIKDKVIRRVSAVYLHRPKISGGSTTLSAATAVGATTFTIAANTGFGNGDTCKVGRGDETELIKINAALSGGGPYTVTPEYPLVYAHAAGDPFVEFSTYDIGDIEAGGVDFRANGETQDVQAATKRLAYTIINGFNDLSMEFRLPTFSIYGMLHALGIPVSAVTGAATTADPRVLTTDGNNVDAEVDACITAVAELMDSTVVTVELWSVNFDYTGIDLQFTTGQVTTVPVKVTAGAGGAASTNAPTYTVDQTLRPTKDNVFATLTEVGTFIVDPSAFSSTIATAAVAAGSKVLELASTTGLAQGHVLKVNTGDLSEYHEINTVSAPNVNLRTPVFRTQPVGTAVVRYVRSVLGGVAQEGVRVAAGGSVEQIRVATSRLTKGTKAGPVVFSFAFGVIDITLESLCESLMIPTSAISGGRFPIRGTQLGTVSVDGVYLKGLTADQVTAEIRMWGCQQELSDFLLKFAFQGVPSMPRRYRPTSGVQFLQYS
jgi:hypothetical protein